MVSIHSELVVVLVVVSIEVGRMLATGGVAAMVLMGLRSIEGGGGGHLAFYVV